MTKRILIAAGLVAALAGGGAIALAQAPQAGPGVQRGPGGPGGPGPRMRGGPMGDLGLRGVELTDAQREQVRSVMESHQTELQQVGTKLRDAHRSFAEAARADTLDENTLRTRSAALAAAMTDEAILRAKVRAELRGILTAEQQQQLNDRSKDRRQHGLRRQQP
jgi:periplasmic protein CpxP/Spy